MTRKLLIGFNWLAAGVLSIVLLLAALMPTDFFNKEDWAKPVILIVTALGFLLILNAIKKACQNISARTYRYWLYGIAGLILIAQVWVAVHFIDATRADVYFVRNQAIALAQGSHRWAYYFKVYPNNVNSALLESVFIKLLLGMGIKAPWMILNLLRFAWIDTGLLSGLVLLKHWQHWRPSGLLLMLTWLLSIPVYSYGVFPYNDALVMPLALNVAALGWLFVNKHGWQRWLAGVATWLLLAMGYVMKSNLVVLIIAVLLTVGLMVVLDKTRWRLAVEWLVGSVVTLGLITMLMTTAAKHNGYVKDPELATPVTSWIAMSLNPDTQGQYHGADFYPIRNTKTQAAKKKMAAESIKSRVEQMGPLGLVDHFYQKLGVFYSHGDFDAINLIAQWLKAPSRYILHQRHYKFWALLLTQSWYLALLIGSIWQLFTQRKHLISTAMLSLVLLGLTAFHVLIWEVEPRYALPLLPIIMLLGCEGWSTMPALALNFKRRLAVSWVLMLGALVGMLNLMQMSKKVTVNQISIAMQGNGAYFTPNTLGVKTRDHFVVQLHGEQSNQLVLHTKSKNRVTIVVKHQGSVLKRVTGQAEKVQQINYPAVHAKQLNVTIINHGKTPALYGSGLLHFSNDTGAITKRPQMTMQWNVNRVFKPKNPTQKIKLTPNKSIAAMTGLFLVLVLVSIWYRPADELNQRKRV
ncbi:hypothetical protein [Lactiplantibacillus pentosus]|uniref:hypothetical protein n=1 Tax=Lactiplantibacillus pentosus TaxID=1589 RepID=UPI00244331B1|nr:hypothetical protein [Lactiplantibacillus pentosus]